MLSLPKASDTFFNSVKFLLLLLLIGIILNCSVNDSPRQKVILEIEPDSNYSEFQKLFIIVSDSDGNVLDTLFEDSLSSPGQLKNLEYPGYNGEKIQIQIIGIKQNQISYSSIRKFNGKAPEETTVDTIFISTFPVANAGQDTTVTPGDSIFLSASAFDPYSSLFVLEWDFGDGNFFSIETGDTVIPAPDTEADLAFILRVTDDEGLQDLDTVFITVAFSSNSFLKVLELENQNLTPDFDKSSLEYTAEVADSTDSLFLKAIPEDKGASVKIEGSAKEDSLYKYPLQTGENNITIVVTAANGDSSLYSLIVNKAANTNAGLLDLNSDVGQWDLEFSTDVFEYTLEINHNTSSIRINFETAQPKSSLVYGSQNLGPKGSFAIDSIAVGDSSVDFTVFAESEKDSQKFTLNIKRPGVYQIQQETPTATVRLPWTPVFLGESFSFSATTPTGYSLQTLIISSGSGTIEDKNSESALITSNSDSLVLVAVYDSLKLSLEIRAAEGVTFTPDSIIEINYNIPQPITSSMSYGYHFKKWTVLEGSAVFDDSTKASTQVRLMEENALISPIFAPDTFDVHFTTNLNPETHNLNFCINNTCETELSSFVQRRTYGEKLVISAPSIAGCLPIGPVACEPQCLSFLSFASLRSGAFGSSDSVMNVTIVDDSDVDLNYGTCN